MDVSLVIIVIIALLALSGFFSGSETALTTVSRAKMRSRAEDGDIAAARVSRLTDDSERLIGSILLGNNLVNILATALATTLFNKMLGPSGLGTVVASIVMTVLVLIFSEVLPKTYAYAYAETFATRVARPVSVVVSALSPAVALVRAIVRLTLAAVGVTLEKDARVLSREAHEEIRGAIDLHHFGGHVKRDNRDMLLAALDLENREVNEVMRHRRDIFTLDADLPGADILSAVIDAPYSRIPLWREESENIIGVLHAKDVLRAVSDRLSSAGGAADPLADLDLTAVAMPAVFTPDATRLNDQLKEFIRRRSHFALVVDEYGALQGLITLEDIIEEIVGEIADEHDEDQPTLTEQVDGWHIVEGQTTIRDLNRAFDWKLPDAEATTIAGLVMHEAQTIPSVGSAYIFHGFRFEILERVRYRITKLRMRPVSTGHVESN